MTSLIHSTLLKQKMWTWTSILVKRVYLLSVFLAVDNEEWTTRLILMMSPLSPRGASPLPAHPCLPWAHTMVRPTTKMATTTPVNLGGRTQVEALLPATFRPGCHWLTTACPCPSTATSVAASFLFPRPSFAACVAHRDYDRDGHSLCCEWNCMALHYCNNT